MRAAKFLVLPLLLAFFPGLTGDQLAPQVSRAPDIRLPLKNGSVRFAVIGDNGTGERPQFQVAEQMQSYWTLVKFDFVLMNGDNIYGGHKPADFERKFEVPYKPLLDESVKFYASLGNHDDPDLERNYKSYNMGGDRYYTFRKRDVQFFALDSNYMDPKQLDWLESQLKSSDAKWKIAFFHHPLFTSAKFHGSDIDLRKQLMPILEKYGVNVVMSGHEHVYERIKPQSGIYFFVIGNSGELRFHNIRHPSDIDVVGFDTDRTFLLVEITGDKLDFEAVSATGEVIDSGELDRQKIG
jgi:3',5'-cyclic AMP phosphodiesterase CpdA